MNRLSKHTHPDLFNGQIWQKLFLVLLLALCTAFSTACKKNASESGSVISPKTVAPATASKPSGQQGNLHKLYVDSSTVWIEIADNEATRQQGLMWREAMPPDQGMLFVFPAAERQSFWMRNTYLPLDIAFIDANWKITDIHHMQPLIDTVYYNSSVPVPYALEVNQGWFAKHKVQVGDKIRLE
jgi:uncharacterized protein